MIGVDRIFSFRSLGLAEMRSLNGEKLHVGDLDGTKNWQRQNRFRLDDGRPCSSPELGPCLVCISSSSIYLDSPVLVVGCRNDIEPILLFLMKSRSFSFNWVISHTNFPFFCCFVSCCPSSGRAKRNHMVDEAPQEVKSCVTDSRLKKKWT